MTDPTTKALEGLAAKWRAEAEGFSDGDASAHRACAAATSGG